MSKKFFLKNKTLLMQECEDAAKQIKQEVLLK
jgi:hypothetical protein